MIDKLIEAIENSNRAQRNYDLSKNIPQKDLDTLIYAAVKSPSKQNETHYSLNVYTDQSIIKEIYNTTKKFTLGIEEALDETKGEEWLYQNRSVKNSQIMSNALFVYVDADSEARNTEHLTAKNGNIEGAIVTERQKNYSIGISIGELILTATLLGYKTGLCSAFNVSDVQKIIGLNKEPKMLVGVGFENLNIDRRLHQDTYNKDVPYEFRTGNQDELWRFPSFTKEISVLLNNKILDI